MAAAAARACEFAAAAAAEEAAVGPSNESSSEASNGSGGHGSEADNEGSSITNGDRVPLGFIPGCDEPTTGDTIDGCCNKCIRICIRVRILLSQNIFLHVSYFSSPYLST